MSQKEERKAGLGWIHRSLYGESDARIREMAVSLPGLVVNGIEEPPASSSTYGGKVGSGISPRFSRIVYAMPTSFRSICLAGSLFLGRIVRFEVLRTEQELPAGSAVRKSS